MATNFRRCDLVGMYGAGFTTRQIAAHFGTSQHGILRRMREWGIARRNAGHLVVEDALTAAQLEMINGELLGDGSIVHTGSYKNARFQWGGINREHGELVLNQLGRLGGKLIEYRHKLSENLIFAVYSKAAPAFTPLRRIWYPSGKKAIPREVGLTSATVRHWFMGDGNLRRRENRRPSVRLATNCFAIEDVDRLREKFAELGIATSRQTAGAAKYPTIYVRSESTRRFFELIGECPAECYRYKWPEADELFARERREGWGAYGDELR